MPLPRLRRSAAILGSFALAVTGLSALIAAPAHANPAGTGLVISEAYGGGGNSGATYTNDFIELYNPTSAAISVAGWSVQYRGAGGTGAGQVTALTGSVPAQGHYLVQEAAGTGGTTPLPTPDATGTIAMGSGGGQVWLADTTSALTPPAGDVTGTEHVIDFVGSAATATSFETAPVSSSPGNPTSVARAADGADTDSNAADFNVGAPSPENAGGTTAPLTVVPVSDQTVAVGTAIDPIHLTANGGTAPYTWGATGLPDGVTLDDDTIAGTPTTTGTYDITVTATDSSEPAETDDAHFTLDVQAATELSIAQIQGTDTDTSPYVGQQVSTDGVVTAVYATGGFNGFFLETGGAGGTASDDETPGASDAVFVYGSASAEQVAVGESVEVVGEVAEYAGLTEIDYPTVTELTTDLPAVVPDQLPWSSLASDAQKEAHEGELVAPQGDFTVTDNYDTNFYGEVELASGDTPLRQPTDVGTAGSSEAQAAAADNAARAVTLDDGSSATFTPGGSAANTPLPWLTADHAVTVGAKATFHQAVILDYRNSLWKFQPTAPLSGTGADVVSFTDLRADNQQPDPLGGDIRLATFNVENYFPTTGQDYVAGGGSCTYYDDRAGNHITVDTCSKSGAPGPRGAATTVSFQRQQAKIVTGINRLGASIVSLEEVENSVKFDQDRDAALAGLVDALNEAAGAGTWAYVASPSGDGLPPTSQQDVIRTALIYKPADVAVVGESHVLADDSGEGQAFSIAREPLAQGFKAVGAPDSDAFLVVANHFKSKGADAGSLFNDCANGGDSENNDPANDQGAFNCTRVHEAQDMSAWATQQAQALGTDRIFLVGDFNAYTHEDPMEELYQQGYADLGSTYDPNQWSYSYNGLEGSLDHVLASPSALAMVTGADIWQINAQESVGYAYSRYNYNITQLFDATDPFAASDHDPVVVGLTLPRDKAPATVTAPAASAVWPKEPALFTVTVTAPGEQPTGTVTLLDHDTAIGSAELGDNGSATITVPAKSYKRGTYTFTVAYSGDSNVLPASTAVILKVTNQSDK